MQRNLDQRDQQREKQRHAKRRIQPTQEVRANGQFVLTVGATDRAMASRRLSAMASAISMKPTGSSPAAWQGRLMAQRSRKLPIVVLRSNSRFFLVKPSGVATSSSVGATMAQVGMMVAS